MLLTAFLGYLEYNPKTTDIKFPIPRKFEVKILSRKSEETGRSEKIIYRNDPWGAPDTLTARCEIRCTRKKAWIPPLVPLHVQRIIYSHLRYTSDVPWCRLYIHQVTERSEVIDAQTKHLSLQRSRSLQTEQPLRSRFPFKSLWRNLEKNRRAAESTISLSFEFFVIVRHQSYVV